jgi:hypothetical protein
MFHKLYLIHGEVEVNEQECLYTFDSGTNLLLEDRPNTSNNSSIRKPSKEDKNLSVLHPYSLNQRSLMFLLKKIGL